MFDLVALIKAAGYVGLFIIVFAESGILIGFFLPGDSLLFTAGFLSSQGYLDIIPLIIVITTAAILGDSVGYTFGKHVGPKLFKKENSLFFHKNHLKKAEEFYKRHGAKTIVLARFMPVIRTFAPIVAGVGKMHYPTFLSYNIIGGIIWGVGLTLAGYVLGNSIPNIDHYLLPIIALIILISISPALYRIARNKDLRAQIVCSIIDTCTGRKKK